jgi:hypothetical protein
MTGAFLSDYCCRIKTVGAEIDSISMTPTCSEVAGERIMSVGFHELAWILFPIF